MGQAVNNMAKFYFTYGSDPRFPFQYGWTEIVAPDKSMACAAFRHYHPDRDPDVRCLNCADVYTEAEFQKTIKFFEANYEDHCHERIVLSLTREALDDKEGQNDEGEG